MTEISYHVQYQINKRWFDWTLHGSDNVSARKEFKEAKIDNPNYNLRVVKRTVKIKTTNKVVKID